VPCPAGGDCALRPTVGARNCRPGGQAAIAAGPMPAAARLLAEQSADEPAGRAGASRGEDAAGETPQL